MPPVESVSDRLALLGDFGLSVRLSPTAGPVDVLAILELPTNELGGIASEIEFLEPSPSLLVRTESLAGLQVEDGLQILEGSKAGLYIARAIVSEDDGEFSRIDIAEA